MTVRDFCTADLHFSRRPGTVLPMNLQPNSPPRVQLPRVLGPWMAMAMIIGTVIGSGVFKKASIVAKNIPEFGLAISAWVLVGVLVLLGALALGGGRHADPESRRQLCILERSLWKRWAGFLFGWVEFWIIRCGSIAAAGHHLHKNQFTISCGTCAAVRATCFRTGRAWP